MPYSLSDTVCGFCEAEREHCMPFCSLGEFTASRLSNWNRQRTYNEQRGIMHCINILSRIFEDALLLTHCITYTILLTHCVVLLCCVHL